MSSRRNQIRMTTDEVDAYLAAQRTVTCATLSSAGRPPAAPVVRAPHADAH